ncbi:MAG: hypothetical protein M3322_00725 [Actinomycetota bacterium]|nr:hypothetical protein [Actinomycetota bacterium]
MPRVDGTHSPPGGADPGDNHLAGFNHAMRDALQKADNALGPGSHRVAVRFNAVLETRSPGRVREYSVVLES